METFNQYKYILVNDNNRKTKYTWKEFNSKYPNIIPKHSHVVYIDKINGEFIIHNYIINYLLYNHQQNKFWYMIDNSVIDSTDNHLFPDYFAAIKYIQNIEKQKIGNRLLIITLPNGRQQILNLGK